MTRNRRPIGFVATSQPDKAEEFYGGILELDLIEASPYALVFADGHTMLRVQIVPKLSVTAHTVHGWEVSDIVAEIAALSAMGVEFLTYESLGQDASGVWTTQDGSKVAWFNDPCGNVLSLTEFALA